MVRKDILFRVALLLIAVFAGVSARAQEGEIGALPYVDEFGDPIALPPPPAQHQRRPIRRRKSITRNTRPKSLWKNMKSRRHRLSPFDRWCAQRRVRHPARPEYVRHSRVKGGQPPRRRPCPSPRITNRSTRNRVMKPPKVL